MRHTICQLFAIAAVYLLIITYSVAGQSSMHKKIKQNLSITISEIQPSSYTEDDMRIYVAFKNVSNQKIRLLDRFEPVPIFFSINMIDASGTPLSIPGAGKIDFAENNLRYITLDKGSTHRLKLDIGKNISPPQKPLSGMYTVSVTYHNQYGENCFTGHIESNSINININ